MSIATNLEVADGRRDGHWTGRPEVNEAMAPDMQLRGIVVVRARNRAIMLRRRVVKVARRIDDNCEHYRDEPKAQLSPRNCAIFSIGNSC